MKRFSLVPLHPLLLFERGWAGQFTRAVADGAWPNGTRVVKQKSEEGDSTPDGTPGIVLGSLRFPDVMNNAIFYFVAWADAPRVAVGCMEWKLRVADGATIPTTVRSR